MLVQLFLSLYFISNQNIFLDFYLSYKLQGWPMLNQFDLWQISIYLCKKKKTNIYLSMYMSIYLYTHSLHQWVLNKFAIFWKLKFKHNAFDFQLQFHKVSLSFSQHSRQNDNHLNFVGMDGTIGYINFSITGASFHLFTFHLFKESDGRTRRPI